MDNEPIFSDQDILDYLLGRLPEPRLEQFEEKSICDPAFFEQIQLTEHDLIVRHLASKLGEDQEAAFRSKYLKNPVLRQKVDFSRALDKQIRIQGAEARDSPGALPTQTSELSVKKTVHEGWFSSSWWNLGWLLAAGAAAVVAFSVIEKPVTPPPSPGPASALREPAKPERMISLLLLPGLEKGRAEGYRIELTDDIREVQLDLDLPGATTIPRANIEVTRVGATGDERVAEQTVEGRTVQGGSVFSIRLPATMLRRDNYIVYLRRSPSNAGPEASFNFSVVGPAAAEPTTPPR